MQEVQINNQRDAVGVCPVCNGWSVKVVDAQMGRGKSTAAINYINAHKNTDRFIYVTPFLSEVARVREQCGLREPVSEDEDGKTKSACLRELIRRGENISMTHSLYELMDEDVLDMVSSKGYVLIIDEIVDVAKKVAITAQDRKLIEPMTYVEEDGHVRWTDESYMGKFAGYKQIADRGVLYRVDDAFIEAFRLNLVTSFKDVFLLTYLFEGSLLDAYFQCFGIPYDIYGIRDTEEGPVFAKGKDCPPPVDYRGLIQIVETKKMNEVGEPYHALAKNWYERRSYHNPSVIALRQNMYNFFRHMTESSKDDRLWTCFKSQMFKLVPDSGRYAGNFLQMQARATNSFSGCVNLAYMVNRFEDPNLIKFFAMRGRTIDQNQCALSDLLQWVWRSAIRNGEPVKLYIPSRRMRELLKSWLDETAGEHNRKTNEKKMDNKKRKEENLND